MSHKVLLKLKQNRYVTRKFQLLESNRKLITLTTLKKKRKWLMSKSRKETTVAGDEAGSANSMTVSSEVIEVDIGADEVAIIMISITLETIRTLMPIKVVLNVAAIVASEVSDKMVKTNSTITAALIGAATIGAAIEENETMKTTSFIATIGAKAIKMQTASRKSRNSPNTEAGEATTRNSTNTTQASTTANRVKTTKVATVVGVIAMEKTQDLIKWKIRVDRCSKATTSIKSD
jgi:hypothetical protein